MRCFEPKLITNPYTHERMYVGCRKCDACRIADANNKAFMLYTEMSKNWYMLAVTLTYDTDFLPVVFYGDDKIRRYNNGHLDVIDILPEPLFTEPIVPYHYPFIECTGVLYYRDFQLFNKRLRINLNRNGIESPRFFVLCEYGTARKRPHFHAIYFFRKCIEFELFTKFVIKSWRMCTETSIRNGIKFVDPNFSFYLASYVNGISNSSGFADKRYLKQKTHRSAYLDFGCDKKDKEIIRQTIDSGIYGFDVLRNTRPFERIDQTKKDSFSIVLLSQRVYYTYFRKPYKFNTLSFNAFCLRARIIRKFKTGYIFQSKPELKQADDNFYRGYLCYLALFDYVDTDQVFDYYLYVFWRTYALYHSCFLRRYMLTYEEKSPKEYFEDAYNSLCRGFDTASFWNDILNQFGFVDGDIPQVLSSTTRHLIHNYVFKYKTKLLPKHFNSLYNFNF